MAFFVKCLYVVFIKKVIIMLLNFEFENFKSYKNKSSISMNATKGTKHNEHLNANRVLPVSVFFGGNGSGKSNFIDAIDFSKSIIVGVDFEEVNFYNLKFRGNGDNNIGKFRYVFLVDNNKYDYTLCYDYSSRNIVSETLNNVRNNKLLYRRNVDKIVEVNDKFLSAKERKDFTFYIKDFASDKKIKSTFIEYLESKEDSTSNFIGLLKKIYNFFDNITIIKTSSKFVAIEKLFENKELKIQDVLNSYGFNIKNIRTLEIDLKKIFDNENDTKSIVDYLHRRNNVPYHLIIDGSPIKFIMDDNGDLKAYRVIFEHNNGELFEFQEESDGTKRIFDLLPIVHLMGKENCLFVIDELDRSLSTHLSYEFLSSFLEQIKNKDYRNNAFNQIIFTTHNLQFLDFDLLRKDEINLIENEDENEGSTIINLNMIDVRTDMDLKRAYWKGSLGGVSKRLIQTIKSKSKLK